jgi:predicted acetyltransferase
MAYVSTEAYKGLLWFAYSHTAQAEKLSWKAPEDDMSYIFLSEPRQDITLKPFVMARVIDVEKVLKLLMKSCTQMPDITMHIEDTMAQWNNETFAIQNGRVQRCNDSIPDLVCSINTFTQLAMGFISPSQAYHLGLLQQNNKDSIEKAHKIFKISNNFINDYY